MKLLANEDMNGGRGPPINRTQDDAAVGYVFQRHPHEADYPHFVPKQTQPMHPPRWASGDEAIIDVSVIYNERFYTRSIIHPRVLTKIRADSKQAQFAQPSKIVNFALNC